ncbi:helix-turn-helix domain-containing protein [Streptomyces sp. TS71-3]|uniref:helix-turn-helix domain-containing protein n=1 Tax=Streptomyces sp. TS71-3 TaxID=2733862 RepID=UPI001B224359|nr:helix-turn-helix transcriptional regulator [Streptomyces sp. TS71-3]GHJ36026.1 transcriptional regulator [Streptomyces sp. TS71-3]
MTSPRLPVGERIRYYRLKNGNRKQSAIAGLCGITERYLSQIENGKAVPSLDVLAAIAAELGVPLAALLSETAADPGSSAALTISPDVAHALMGYGPPVSAGPATAVSLRERVEDAWRIWQTSETRFTEAQTALPQLIADTEHAVRAHRRASDSTDLREVHRAAADLYGLLRSYCRRTGRLDLALMAADRATRAAEDADDPVRIAAAQWNLGHVLLSQEDGADEAADVAERAVEQLKKAPATSEVTALKGALELVSVVADARRHRWWDARARLEKHVLPLSKQAGEGNTMWTVFGPTNVHLHALSIEMLAGESAEGLRVADHVDISQLPSRERQWTFTLEVARCYDLRRDDAAVLVHLLALEELSSEDMARSRTAAELVGGLLRRVRPTYRPQVTGLAERLGYL